MMRNINPKFWNGDTVYSTLYREANKGIIYHVRCCGDPAHPFYEYMVLFEDGEYRVESELTLSNEKP